MAYFEIQPIARIGKVELPSPVAEFLNRRVGHMRFGPVFVDCKLRYIPVGDDLVLTSVLQDGEMTGVFARPVAPDIIMCADFTNQGTFRNNRFYNQDQFQGRDPLLTGRICWIPGTPQ